MRQFLYDQVANHLTDLIHARVLRPGDRLPSVRQLAVQRRVAISTVLQALRQLEDRGLVEARPQSGHFVRLRPSQQATPTVQQDLQSPTPVGVNALLMQVLLANDQCGGLPLGAAHPALSLLPAARMQRTIAAVARQRAPLLGEAHCTDYTEAGLARQLVRRSLACGGPLDAAEIVVTNSCTEALNLCLRAVTRPGDTVALESPTYFVLLQILESLGLQALEIPTDTQTGISVEALELATRHGAVQAVLLIPNANNPLGYVMPEANKRRVAELLATRDIPLIEDDIYGDLHFAADRPWPIKAYDTTGNVMLCSSFSKTVGVGMRLGYVAAGRRLAQVQLMKTLSSGVTDRISQLALARFLEGGSFEREIRTARRAYARQIARMADAVAARFPEPTRVAAPAGGFVLWVELPPQVDTLALHDRATAQGIAFVPGQLFSASARYRHCLRLNCGHPWTDRFDDSIDRLGHLIRQAIATT